MIDDIVRSLEPGDILTPPRRPPRKRLTLREATRRMKSLKPSPIHGAATAYDPIATTRDIVEIELVASDIEVVLNENEHQMACTLLHLARCFGRPFDYRVESAPQTRWLFFIPESRVPEFQAKLNQNRREEAA